MSVQTQIDRITDEVSTQSDLIAQLIETANNLPDAGSGGGGSVEVVTGTISTAAPILEGTVYYVDANGNLLQASELGTITVAKNSIVGAASCGLAVSHSGSITELCRAASYCYCFYVTGDFKITI